MWITPAFDSADFVAAPSGSWPVRSIDVITYEYKIVDGDTMLLNWVIGNTNVSGSPTSLRIRIPGGYRAVKRIEPPMYYTDAWEDKEMGYADVNPAIPCWIGHFKFNLAPWVTTAQHNTALHGSAAFQVIL